MILACELTQAANDAAQLAPMINQARRELADAGVSEPMGTVVADGGYWNSPAIAAIRSSGADVLIPTCDPLRTRPRTLAPAKARRPGASRPPSPSRRGARATGAASS